jgi:hypothetical protein
LPSLRHYRRADGRLAHWRGAVDPSSFKVANRDSRHGPIGAPVTVSTEPPISSASSSTLLNTSTTVILVNRMVCATRPPRVWSLRPYRSNKTPPPRKEPGEMPPAASGRRPGHGVCPAPVAPGSLAIRPFALPTSTYSDKIDAHWGRFIRTASQHCGGGDPRWCHGGAIA